MRRHPRCLQQGGIADVGLTTKGREMLLRIVSMLIKLCKRHAT
jgi:hypothetical protein